MKNIFSLDSPLIQTLSFVFDLILVNMLYILCCIPVVTIGAARAALYTCGNLWAEKDDAGATTFLKAFFKNLKTATPVWLILLAVGAFLVWDVWLLSVNSIPLEWLLWVLIAVPLVAYVIVACQMFQVVAHYNCTVKQYIKNAFLVGLGHPLYTVIHAVLFALPYFALFYNLSAFMMLSLIWMMGYFSVQGIISGLMSKKYYKRLTDRLTGVTDENGDPIDPAANRNNADN